MGFLSGLLGLGKGPSQSTTPTMPAWLQGPAQDYLNRVVSLSNQAYTPYGGQTVAGFTPQQQQAMQSIFDRGMGGSPLTQAAQGNLQDTISGRYLSEGNPYLSGMIDQAQGDVVRNYNTVVKPQTEAAMVRSGSFGNSGLLQMQQQQQSDLQRNLGNISTNMRGQNYAQERGLQQQASLAAPGVANADFFGMNQALGIGGMQQNQSQAGLDDQYRRFIEQQQFPYQQLQFLGGALNPLMSNYRGNTTTSQASDQSRYGNALGTLGSIFGYFSDKRMKEDIKKVGKTDEGLNVYTYRYKGDPRTQMGVMAQEVQKKDPDAVMKHGSGLLMVDYRKVK